MSKLTVKVPFEVEVFEGPKALAAFHKRLEETNDPADAAATELVQRVSGRNVSDTVPLRRAICADGDALDAIKRAAGWTPPPPAAEVKKKATAGDAQ